MESGYLKITVHTSVHSPPKTKTVRIEDQKADLSNLCLQEIPLNISQHVFRITTLKLNHNRISEISSAFVSANPNLRVLEIDDNFIQSLPDNIGDLTNLIRLSAAQNELQVLPLSFYKLKDLKYLNLENNPMCVGLKFLYFFEQWTPENCYLAARRSVCAMNETKDFFIVNFPEQAWEILGKDFLGRPSTIGADSNYTRIVTQSSDFVDVDNANINPTDYCPFEALEQEVFRVDLQLLAAKQYKEKAKHKFKVKDFPKSFMYYVWIVFTYLLWLLFTLIYFLLMYSQFVETKSIREFLGKEISQTIGINQVLSFREYLQKLMIQYNYPQYFANNGTECLAQNEFNIWEEIKDFLTPSLYFF